MLAQGLNENYSKPVEAEYVITTNGTVVKVELWCDLGLRNRREVEKKKRNIPACVSVHMISLKLLAQFHRLKITVINERWGYPVRKLLMTFARLILYGRIFVSC